MLRRAEAVRSIAVPIELLFAVLADYERYPEWLPELAEARVLAREGDVVLVEVWLPRFRSGKVVLEMIQSPPSEILFSQVGYYGRPEIAGRCELTATAEDGTRVRVELRAEMPLFGLGRRRLRGALAGGLETLDERAADVRAGRALASPLGGEDRDRRKILEIVEHDDGLEIRLRGNRYRLIRLDGEAS